jgi:octaprenyl-diphosphate synthase
MLETANAPLASQPGLGLLREDLHSVEELLRQRLGGPLPLLREVSEHVVEAGGKRLRPLLCLLAGRAAGVSPFGARRVAAAAELIHTASLLHDDVVDQATFRRGRPAAPRLFGNSACVLVGDALLASGLALLAELSDPQPLRSSARCVRSMAVGEVQQLVRAASPWQPGRHVLLNLLRVIEAKTSALFAWCSTVGDLCPPPLRSALARFGRRLGIAFQIADDILDLEGDPRCTGKEPGTDLREGKLTVPVLLACVREPRLWKELDALGPAPADEPLQRVIEEIRRSGGPGEARAAARRLLQRAHRSLDVLPPSIWRQELHRLADAALHRSA